MYACVYYVSTRANMSAFVSLSIHTRFARVHVCVYLRIHMSKASVCVHVYVFVFTLAHSLRSCVCVQIRIHTRFARVYT